MTARLNSTYILTNIHTHPTYILTQYTYSPNIHTPYPLRSPNHHYHWEGSLEGALLEAVLQLQEDWRVLSSNVSAEGLPITIQNLLPNLHALETKANTIPDGPFLCNMHLETGQLVTLKFLLLLHPQFRRLDRAHLQVVPMHPRKDILEPSTHVL